MHVPFMLHVMQFTNLEWMSVKLLKSLLQTFFGLGSLTRSNKASSIVAIDLDDGVFACFDWWHLKYLANYLRGLAYSYKRRCVP